MLKANKDHIIEKLPFYIFKIKCDSYSLYLIKNENI